MSLSMVSLGESKTIKELVGKDSVKKHLQSLGFIPGEKVEIISENTSGIILLAILICSTMRSLIGN